MPNIFIELLPFIIICIHLGGFLAAFSIHIFNGSYKEAIHKAIHNKKDFNAPELFFIDVFFWLPQFFLYRIALENAKEGEDIKF